METLGELGEFGFIDRISHHRPAGPVVRGIGDDCAVFPETGGRVRLVTTDMMVEHVHFTREASPEGLGYKLLAVNLSDVAAMGGRPTDAVVSVAVPADQDAGFMERLYHGLYACADRFQVVVGGGDTTRSPGPLVLNLALNGKMDGERVCYRSGSRPGDEIFVSGTLGDSGAGLVLAGGQPDISPVDRSYLLRRHHRPEPRIDLGHALSECGAVTAMIDVSDGVASDLRHLCDQSGVSAVLEAESIPLSAPFRAFCRGMSQEPIKRAITNGEDYELLFTVCPDRIDTVLDLGRRADLPPIRRIGRIQEGSGTMSMETAEGERLPLSDRGYDHFRSAH